MKSDSGQRILDALSKIGLDWSLCFIGEDQPAKLGRLSIELKRPKSTDGNGKRVPSGYSYWGIVPTVAWRDTCEDVFYTLMRESIKNFPKAWADIKGALDTSTLHYASLGPGTGEKDAAIVRTLSEANKNAFFFPIDMSPEMLRLGTKRAVENTSISRGNVLPIQIDFSTRENVEEISKLVQIIIGEDAVLYSLLGNTLSNFEDDEQLLSNIAFLLRPQDLLLLEIATTDRVTSDAASAAASEYDQSEKFKHFVSSSLIQNTNLPVNIKNIEFLHSVESDRALLVKTVYRNNSQTFEMRVGSNVPVLFTKADTIRLSTVRKYSSAGIGALIRGAGLKVIYQTKKLHLSAAKKGPNFGSALILLQTGEKPALEDMVWDFFIAHAGADIAAAEQLYRLLSQKNCRVFLDKYNLKLGDSWGSKLSEAQAKSRVTVVLISNSTSAAYYEREEIAAAIALARRNESKHRVVPVYVGEQGDTTELDVPYGLRLKHSADLRKSDVVSVVKSLIDCLQN